MPLCFECMKEHEQSTQKTFEAIMFCSKKCYEEWNERTKDWIFPEVLQDGRKNTGDH